MTEEVPLEVEMVEIKRVVYLLEVADARGGEGGHSQPAGTFSRYTLAHARAEEIAQEIAKKKGIGRVKFELEEGQDDSYRTLVARGGCYDVAIFHISRMTVDE